MEISQVSRECPGYVSRVYAVSSTPASFIVASTQVKKRLDSCTSCSSNLVQPNLTRAPSVCCSKCAMYVTTWTWRAEYGSGLHHNGTLGTEIRSCAMSRLNIYFCAAKRAI